MSRSTQIVWQSVALISRFINWLLHFYSHILPSSSYLFTLASFYTTCNRTQTCPCYLNGISGSLFCASQKCIIHSRRVWEWEIPQNLNCHYLHLFHWLSPSILHFLVLVTVTNFTRNKPIGYREQARTARIKYYFCFIFRTVCLVFSHCMHFSNLMFIHFIHIQIIIMIPYSSSI